ncbi:hypothetical protein R1flu_006288 [Riccia fluitans]|uniref:Uncharacterized protein n=1 Tax=Riccia fluitans TaxID=41844 RepID=A0ABD1YYD3_9MARC
MSGRIKRGILQKPCCVGPGYEVSWSVIGEDFDKLLAEKTVTLTSEKFRLPQYRHQVGNVLSDICECSKGSTELLLLLCSLDAHHGLSLAGTLPQE